MLPENRKEYLRGLPAALTLYDESGMVAAAALAQRGIDS